MKSMSVTFSVLSVILGISAALPHLQRKVLNPTVWYQLWVLSPCAIAFAGLATLVLIYVNSRFGNTVASVAVSAFVCTTAAMLASTTLLLPSGTWNRDPGGGLILMFVEIGMVVFSFCLCPYLFIQSAREARHMVVGFASAKDRISISEISRDTGLPESTVRKHLHNAVKNHRLLGRIEGDTYVGTQSVSKARRSVKQFKTCPYCGAKTNLDISKCQNCGRDLSSAL